MQSEPQIVENPFSPVFDARSRILIVGTMPSAVSRAQNFYYGNPRNRFWSVLASLLGAPQPASIEQKKDLLLENRIALSDVLRSCEIRGSSDLSIRKAEPNDFGALFKAADIRHVFANGRTAFRYYQQFVGEDVEYLPSTSPANASFSEERLLEHWSVLLPYLQNADRTPQSGGQL